MYDYQHIITSLPNSINGYLKKDNEIMRLMMKDNSTAEVVL